MPQTGASIPTLFAGRFFVGGLWQLEFFTPNNGTPDDPDVKAFTTGSPSTVDTVIGSYNNTGGGGTVYFHLFDMADTGGIQGTWSGSFCFSLTEDTCSPTSVPVPSTLALLSLGLLGVVYRRRQQLATD
jgi:hypothetical protein